MKLLLLRLMWGGLLLTTSCTHEGGWPRECPSPNRPGVNYIHATYADRGVCAYADYICREGEVDLGQRFPKFYENHCGCGCFGAREDHDEARDGMRAPAPEEPEPLRPCDSGESPWPGETEDPGMEQCEPR